LGESATYDPIHWKGLTKDKPEGNFSFAIALERHDNTYLPAEDAARFETTFEAMFEKLWPT